MDSEYGLTRDGIIFLVFGWSFITSLTVYCFSKVLFKKK
jgi:hypothetical protein